MKAKKEGEVINGKENKQREIISYGELGRVIFLFLSSMSIHKEKYEIHIYPLHCLVSTTK